MSQLYRAPPRSYPRVPSSPRKDQKRPTARVNGSAPALSLQRESRGSISAWASGDKEIGLPADQAPGVFTPGKERVGWIEILCAGSFDEAFGGRHGGNLASLGRLCDGATADMMGRESPESWVSRVRHHVHHLATGS